MSRYQVSTPRVLWEYVTVEADDEQDALDRVAEGKVKGPKNICAHCSGGLFMREEWSRDLSAEPLYISEGETMRFAIKPCAEKLED